MEGDTSVARRVERPGLDRARLEAIFANVPAAIALLEGPEHRFALANDEYRALVGGRDLLGLTVAEALPEVLDQGFNELLDRVFESGEPHYGNETRVLLDRGSGELEPVFVNFAYLPVRDADGSVGAVLAHAVEVTELVRSRQTVEALVEQLRTERRQLESLIEQMPAGVVIAEVPSGRLVAANERWREFFGVPPESIGGIEQFARFEARRPDGSLYAAEEYPLARTVRTGDVVVGEELTLRRWDGKSRVVEVNSVPIVRNGVAELAVATFFDVTELRRNAELIAANNALLRLVASGAPLARVLEDLVLMLERHAGGELLGSVLLLDRDGVHLRHGAAPSLPQAYNEAIDGIEIGPSVGSCGTAAFRREAVTVSDIEHDPLWADFRDLALEHGLRACWSTPIFSREGEVLGTFAMYHRERAEPRDEHLVLVEIATRTAALAIEQRRLQDESERSFFVVEQLNRVGEAINATLDLQDVVQVVTDAATELTGADFGAFFYNVIREDGEAYTLYTLSGVPRAAFERFPMPRNTKIFDPTFKGTAVVRIADVKQDPRYGRNPPYHGMPEGHLPVTSYLAAPVKNIAGDVLGGLFFGHKDAGVFTEEHERLVVGIAAQAAVAIERAHLFVSEQNARAEAERRAQAALSLEHVSDGVCLVDGDGVVRVWNPAAARITGAPASRVVGGPLAECFPAFETVADHETTIRVRSGGRDLWLAVAATPFADGVVYTFRDRTSEHRLEEMRTEIVATVSHELRTPLAAVYGAAQTLARPEVTSDDAAREKLLQMIVDETQRLTRVADQILTTSDLEQREADEPLADVDVSNLLAQVAELGAGRGEVALTVTADPGLRARAGADKLRQVLTNLLDNAVKYGGAGGRVELRARAHGADRVRLSVADWGPGVPPGEATRVFDRFYRLDPDQRSGVAGTGLGLYICRELVRRMDGDIWVEPTRPDCGATFVIDLAAAPAT